MNLPKDLTSGRRLVVMREAYEVKQGELAEELGIPIQAIIAYEKDRLVESNLFQAVERAAFRKTAEQEKELVAA